MRAPGKTARKARRARRQNTRDLARATVARDARGHFLPGVSGNPAGRPREERELRELARSYGQEAIERLVHLMRDAGDERVQLGAAEALLTRGYGRPVEGGAGPLVSINVGANGVQQIVSAEQAAAMYQDMMTGTIDVTAVEFAQPALPAPGDADSAMPSPVISADASDARVEAVDTAAERLRTWGRVGK